MPAKLQRNFLNGLPRFTHKSAANFRRAGKRQLADTLVFLPCF